MQKRPGPCSTNQIIIGDLSRTVESLGSYLLASGYSAGLGQVSGHVALQSENLGCPGKSGKTAACPSVLLAADT